MNQENSIERKNLLLGEPICLYLHLISVKQTRVQSGRTEGENRETILYRRK